MIPLRAPLAATLLLATILAPLAPTALAAEPTLSDANGDVAFSTGAPGGDATAPAGLGGAVDLTGLAIEETDDALTLVLGVAAMGERIDGSGEYLVGFSWGRVLYTAYLARYSYAPLGSDFTWGMLAVRGDESQTQVWEMEGVAPLEPVVDVAAGTITVKIEKVLLLDHDARPPVKGAALRDLRVDAKLQTFGFTVDGNEPLSFHDAMPDEGSAEYAFVAGDEATGHLLLRSYDRVRVSNGGATTFVFQAMVRNAGDAHDDVALRLVDVPEGWNATVMDRVSVGPGEELGIPVIATVPFAHDHGGYTAFTLEATSSADPSAFARLRLGVLHTPIPQPAGHHDELFLHGTVGGSHPFSQLFPMTELWMNTLDEHEGEAAEIPSRSREDDWFTWVVPLKPGLQMGLDFDLGRTGTLDGSVLGRASGEGEVRAQLLLVHQEEGWWSLGFDQGLVLAESEPQALTLDLQQPSTFSLPLTPTPEADYVGYQKGQNVVLILGMRPPDLSVSCCFVQTTPALRTEDFKLKLPLDEYHDRAETATGGDGGGSPLALVAEGPVQRPGRPGTTLTYAFTLENRAPVPLTVDVDLAGTHAQAGELAPEGTITLQPGESRALTLGVRVPAEAEADELIEVLVFAHASENPAISAIARTITRVTPGEGADADESAAFAAAKDEANETPGAGALGALAAVALAALVLARRRRA